MKNKHLNPLKPGKTAGHRLRKRNFGKSFCVFLLVLMIGLLPGFGGVSAQSGGSSTTQNDTGNWVVNSDDTLGLDANAAANAVRTVEKPVSMVLIGAEGGTITLPTVSGTAASVLSSKKDSAVIIYSTAKTKEEVSAMLQGVRFSSGTNSVNISVSDGETKNIDLTNQKSYGIMTVNGEVHIYQYVNTPLSSWIEAYDKAVKGESSLGGFKGYLATVTSTDEAKLLNDFYKEVAPGETAGGWIAGTSMRYAKNNNNISDYSSVPDSKVSPSNYEPVSSISKESITNGYRIKGTGGAYYWIDKTEPSTYAKYFYWACGPEQGQAIPNELWKKNDSNQQAEPNNSSGESVVVASYTNTALFNDFTPDNTKVPGYFLEFSAYDGGHTTGTTYKSTTIYKVSYDANTTNGGTGTPPDIQAKFKDQSMTLAVKPDTLLNSNAGKGFNGWNTKADGKGTHYDAGATLPAGTNQSLKLYAEWVDNPAQEPTVTGPADTTVTYKTSKNLEVRAAVSAEVDKHKLSYQWYSTPTGDTKDGTEISGATSATYAIPTDLNVGDYYYFCRVTAARTDNTNKANVFSRVAKVTVENANPTVNAPTAKTLTYNGSNQDLITGGTVTGGTMLYALGGENQAPTEESAYSTTVPAQKDAGDYYVWYKVKGDANYNNTEAVKVPVTIAKKALTVTAKDKTITYGDVPANDGVKYEGFAGSERESVLGGTLDYKYSYQQYGNVGEYTITPEGLSSNNYEITFNNGTLTVGQKEVGLTWSDTSFTYDSNSHKPTATATGTVNQDAIGVTVTGEQIDADTYTATATELTGEKAGNYKLPTDNTTSFTIEKAYQTITAKDVAATYGDTDKKVTASVVKPSEGAGALSYAAKQGSGEYITVNASTGELKITGVPSDGKAYVIVTAPELTNYKETTKEVTVTISKKDFEPTVSIEGWTYGDTANTPSVSNNTSDGSVTYTYATKGSTDFTKEVPTAAGEYTVKATIVTTNNYNGAEATADFTIAKKDLTVTAKDKTITYGDVPANDGVVYDGFAGSETESVLDKTTLAYDYGYQQYGNVGEYTITPKGLTSNNYNITFNNGTLTVGQKEVGLTWANTESLIYNKQPQAPTATATETVNNDAINVTVAGAQTNAGTYTATASGLTGAKAGNYKLPAEKTHNFSIAPKELKIIADAKSKTYGEDDPPLTYTQQGLEESDRIEGQLSRVQGDNVGTYEIQQGTVTAGSNYSITYIPAMLTINKADSGKSIEPPTAKEGLVYNGQDQDLLNTLGTVQDGKMVYGVTTDATVQPTDWNDTAPKGTDAGTYYVWYKGSWGGNYQDTAPASVQVSIAPKSIEGATINLKNTELTYNGNEQTDNVESVTLDTHPLTSDKDYDASYQNNKNVRKADADNAPTVIVTGKGNYTGTVTATFTIKPYTITQAKVNITPKPIPNQAYTGSPTHPEITVTKKDTVTDLNDTIVANQDYYVTYENNIEVGTTAKAIIHFDGEGTSEKYTGDNIEVTYQIVKGADAPNPEDIINPTGGGGGVTVDPDTGGVTVTDPYEIVPDPENPTGEPPQPGDTIYVREKGTPPGEPTQITLPGKADVPRGVGAEDCTTPTSNDGQLTGVNSTMEYLPVDNEGKPLSGKNWTPVPDSTYVITNQAAGKYQVRTKAVVDASGKIQTCASDPLTLTINQPIQTTVGDQTVYVVHASCNLRIIAPIFNNTEFGEALPGAKEVRIYNDGNTEAEIVDVALNNTDFEITRQLNTTTIKPREEVSLRVRPTNADLGKHEALISLNYQYDSADRIVGTDTNVSGQSDTNVQTSSDQTATTVTTVTTVTTESSGNLFSELTGDSGQTAPATGNTSVNTQAEPAQGANQNAQPQQTVETQPTQTTQQNTVESVQTMDDTNVPTTTLTNGPQQTAQLSHTVTTAHPTIKVDDIWMQKYDNGKAIEPAVTVRINGRVLQPDYYTVAYTNNREVGTAYAMVTLKDGYQGEGYTTFNIVEEKDWKPQPQPQPSSGGSTTIKDGKINFYEETIPVKAGESYSTDNGKTWFKVPEDNAKLVDLGWNEDNTMTIIVKESSGQETKYEVPVRDKAPTKLTTSGVSKAGQSDGKILGVDNTMEYSVDGGKTWQKVTGDSIEGLGEGDVMVRIAATDSSFASKPATLTIKVKSDKEEPGEKSLYFAAHVEDLGWDKENAKLDPGSSATVGISGQSKRVEAVAVMVPKDYKVVGFAHVQNEGDVDIKKVESSKDYTIPEGYVAYQFGSVGKSQRVEAVCIGIMNEAGEYLKGFQYTTHLQNYGWQGYVRNGSFAGSRGMSLRMESIRFTYADPDEVTPKALQDEAQARTNNDIKAEQTDVKAADDNKPSIYFTAHVQNLAWDKKLTELKPGGTALAGTTGKGYRVEAVTFVVPKDYTVTGFAHVQNEGDVAIKKVDNPEYIKDMPDGYVAYEFGSTGKSQRVEAVCVGIKDASGQYLKGFQYATHLQNFGWQGYVRNGSFGGSRAMSLRMESIRFAYTDDDVVKAGEPKK